VTNIYFISYCCIFNIRYKM